MSPRFAAVAATLVLAGGAAAQDSGLTSYSVDAAASHLYVVTHKAGLLGFLGSEHAMVPGEWTAELCLADPIPAGAHGAIVIRSASLVIDSDSARSLADLGGGPGEEDREEIQRKMLTERFLHADGFPEIRLELRAPEAAEGDEVDAEGVLSLRGITNDVGPTVLAVDRAEGGAIVLSGALRIRMRDFGIEPESTARVVKVANEVDLHVRLVARPGEGGCEPGAPS